MLYGSVPRGTEVKFFYSCAALGCNVLERFTCPGGSAIPEPGDHWRLRDDKLYCSDYCLLASLLRTMPKQEVVELYITLIQD